MKLLWQIGDEDIRRVKEFYEERKDEPFVAHRRERNIEGNYPGFTRASFWKVMIGCLLTTQQRSGPNSAVARFGGSGRYPLNYNLCKQQPQLKRFVQKTLTEFGGIRRANLIADEIHHNLTWLEEDGGWAEVREEIAQLEHRRKQDAEIRAAEFIEDNLKGFGPKQSRNLLQELGLTRFEIPIDSRITRWLNDFGFPVPLSAKALFDRGYYRFVSTGFRKLCASCRIYPCVLDAAIFSRYD